MHMSLIVLVSMSLLLNKELKSCPQGCVPSVHLAESPLRRLLNKIYFSEYIEKISNGSILFKLINH